jgi:choline dehydrogenase-like flavoprotein
MMFNEVPSFRYLRNNYPIAYKSLTKHIHSGSSYKSFALRVFICLSRFKLLLFFPILSGLLKTSRALVFAHITESETLITTEEMGASSLDNSALPPEVDVLIIGSGPGGAVAARIEASRESSSILVLERGLWPRTPHYAHHSLNHVMNDFYQGGQEIILSTKLPLFAQGNTVGGGSEVNSGLYHKLPEVFVENFVRAIGIEKSEWENAERIIHDWLQPESMNVQDSNSVIARGALQLDLEFSNIPRWRSYDEEGGYVHRGMNDLYWKEFIKSQGNMIISGIEVLRIDRDSPKHLKVYVLDRKSKKTHVIRANRVHLSAGTVSSPTILIKSGLINARDTSFSWHPMTRVVAKSREDDLGCGDIDPFQAWTSDRKLKFGSAVSTPSLLAIALGERVSAEEARKLRSYYVSYTSSGKGGISRIMCLPWYRFSRGDKKLQKLGLENLLKLVSAGGAEVLNVEKLKPNKHSTVHVFGSLPLGSDIYLPGSNRLRVDPRIRISDGSLLPIGPGVNPQGVIMTTVRLANRDLINE